VQVQIRGSAHCADLHIHPSCADLLSAWVTKL
jgi:hypothetical protein